MQEKIEAVDVSKMSLEELKDTQRAVRNLLFELRAYVATNNKSAINIKDFLGMSFNPSVMSVAEINSTIKDCLSLYRKLTVAINSKHQ